MLLIIEKLPTETWQPRNQEMELCGPRKQGDTRPLECKTRLVEVGLIGEMPHMYHHENVMQKGTATYETEFQ